MNDKHILEKQFLDGNDGVYILLYNSYVDQLYSYGRGMGFDKETLKDAIHDVFLSLLVKRSRLKEVKNVRAYLFRSLYNRLIDIKRSESDGSDAEAADLNVPEMHISVTILDSMMDVEQSRLVSSNLERLINQLSPMQRSAIYMRFMYEMEYAEIADILDVTPHAARKFVSKGINNIRSHKDKLLLLMILGLGGASANLFCESGGQNLKAHVFHIETRSNDGKLR